eukprot:11101346-Prorocentrum_lima.AAC.1
MMRGCSHRPHSCGARARSCRLCGAWQSVYGWREQEAEEVVGGGKAGGVFQRKIQWHFSLAA